MEATVSTIVLLAVTITVAVGVAYWMGGINAIYTQYEQLEIHTITCNIVRGITRSYWEIEIKCKNSGPRTITVDALFLNNIPTNSRELIPPVGGISSNLPINGQTILSGETKSIFIFAPFFSDASVFIICQSITTSERGRGICCGASY